MEDNYVGIDYGNGLTNRDPEAGIHYGVINQNEVLQTWVDEAEPDYGKPLCPICNNEVDLTTEFEMKDHLVTDNDGNEIMEEYYCAFCDKGVDENDPAIWRDEPLVWYYSKDGYQAECGDDGDIFITESPYYTTCQYCSPCAPGAGYIMDTVKDGIKSYCFGPDWFENEKAPYPVFDVKTGKEV